MEISPVDYGRLNFFFKQKHEIDEEELVDLDNNQSFSKNQLIVKKFDFFKYRQKYMQSKFNCLIEKKGQIKNQNKIFKKNINPHSSNFQV